MESRDEPEAREERSDERNVVLIGMPGVGKTTIGSLLARRLRRPFVDTDRVIEDAEGRPLKEILAERGVAG
ncbi:MAG TPA: shikimate kinase, partial [Planctomycetota bacterium]|nr:shikimate kinase [Planctomycetota bacterium]